MSKQVEKNERCAAPAPAPSKLEQAAVKLASERASTAPAPAPAADTFAVKYDPKDVAELASRLTLEDSPVVQLATGELKLAPQFHLVGRCGRGFLTCECDPHDYVYAGLPEPKNTAQDALVRRWCCLVKTSPAMGSFAADQWYNEHGVETLKAITAKEATLVKCVEGFVENLIEDPNLATLARLADLPDGVQTAYAINVISTETRQARSAFLAGDWSLVTRLGGTLLHIAMQTSDPSDVPDDDNDIKRLFAAVDILQSVLASGYSKEGWRLAPESARGGHGFECASTRLPAKPDAPLAPKPPEGYDGVD